MPKRTNFKRLSELLKMSVSYNNFLMIRLKSQFDRSSVLKRN